ncbi:uncharacterized protein LOC103362665 isoform X3 [Stegastes partitus]|uniref:Uncharacterized protein LOC103362665 isoform X3 n=1 Tax=Stegastes partitus TaxID=144197 RepID=A0A9Y4K3D3_9TELE|nr:PREDICTED: uncharacterized protein LOC103362665 isoform X3 [Stegastes partitus]
MQCSRPPSWSLSSTSWEGNWDTGGGTGPCRSRVDGAKAERCANNGVFPDSRPKSSRYCRQPLLNNLSASIALSFIASGFSVIFTLMDPVPQSVWAAYHVFGLLSCGHGLCTAILTLTAAACAQTTPELYHTSLILTAASTLSTGFFLVRGGLWLTTRRPVTDQSRD